MLLILINNITVYFTLCKNLLHGPQNIICMVTQQNLTSQNKQSILNVIQTMVWPVSSQPVWLLDNYYSCRFLSLCLSQTWDAQHVLKRTQ